jgi:hypothetical protein
MGDEAAALTSPPSLGSKQQPQIPPSQRRLDDLRLSSLALHQIFLWESVCDVIPSQLSVTEPHFGLVNL